MWNPRVILFLVTIDELGHQDSESGVGHRLGSCLRRIGSEPPSVESPEKVPWRGELPGRDSAVDLAGVACYCDVEAGKKRGQRRDARAMEEASVTDRHKRGSPARIEIRPLSGLGGVARGDAIGIGREALCIG
jgi:hypothetical protein